MQYCLCLSGQTVDLYHSTMFRDWKQERVLNTHVNMAGITGLEAVR